jgi:membrane-associated phospholipid phosphatase
MALKALGITAFMALFFVAYFHLLRHPARAVTVMPLTALDRAIPFQPAAYAAYVSLWFYVCLAPGLLRTRRELLAYALWAAGLCLAGLACFYFAPTAVPPRPADPGAQYPALALLQGVDAAGNACPSLHVATALFSAIWIDRLLRGIAAPGALLWANCAWLTLIVYSTLAIRQHVAIDVVAGAALGAVFGWASLRACAGAAWPQAAPR